MPGLEKGELPTGGVGGERLVAVAVAVLEGVQGRAWVRQFTADDDPHAGAVGGPLAQVEHLGDVDDVGVLTQVPVGVAGDLPGPLRHRNDGVPDGVGDGVADRELQALLGQRGDQGVGVAGAVGPDQDRCAAPPVRQLAQRPVHDGEVISGGVTAGVARPQHRGQGFAGVVQPRAERVVAETALEVALGAFLVRMRRHEGRVEVDHHLSDRLAGSAGAGQLSTREFAAGPPGPVPGLGAGQPDRREHPGGVRDAGQHPPDRRGRRDAAGRPVQTLLISQHLHVADRDGTVGDRDRDRYIDQHPARVVPGAALPKPVGGLTQRCGQPDPVGELRQQHRHGVRHHPRPVTGDDRTGPARC